MTPPLDASNVNPSVVNRGRRRTKWALRFALVASVALHFAVAFWALPTFSVPPIAPLQATITVVSAPQTATVLASAADPRAPAAESRAPAAEPLPSAQAPALPVAPSPPAVDSRTPVTEGPPTEAEAQEPAATRSEPSPDGPAVTQSTPEASPVADSTAAPTPVAAAAAPLEAPGKGDSTPAPASAADRANGPPGQAGSGTDSPTAVASGSAQRDAASLEGAAPAPSNEAAASAAPLGDDRGESASPPLTQPAPPNDAPGTATAEASTSLRPHVFIVYLRPAMAPPQFPDSTQALPLRVDLSYKLFTGAQAVLIGEGTYSFERTGDAYHILSVGHARGFAAAIAPGEGKLESRGVITSLGLQPQEFSVERGSPDKREVARFDWGTGIVDLHEHKLERFDPWTSDPMAFMWQFHFSPPKTDQLSLSLATTRRIYRYTVSREGKERIVWSHGSVNTEIWHRRSDDGKTDSYVWLAPSLHYVPVKVRVVVANVGTIEALLETARVEEAPAK